MRLKLDYLIFLAELKFDSTVEKKSWQKTSLPNTSVQNNGGERKPSSSINGMVFSETNLIYLLVGDELPRQSIILTKEFYFFIESLNEIESY